MRNSIVHRLSNFQVFLLNQLVMTKHILLEFAVPQPHKTAPHIPDGATYSFKKGYWILGKDALVDSHEFRKSPQTTKKGDFETGEDIKGE